MLPFIIVQNGFPFSGMIAFDINVAEEFGEAATMLFLDSMKLISNQVSLGDVKTLAAAPGLSTQQQVPLEERKLTGIRSTTIRLSVGMEHYQDICDDIDQALAIATAGFELLPATDREQMQQFSKLSLAETDAVIAAKQRQTAPASKSHAASIAEKSSRLKVLYDQMSAISAEMEALQQGIKAEGQLLQQDK
jgi:hypothetical protein